MQRIVPASIAVVLIGFAIPPASADLHPSDVATVVAQQTPAPPPQTPRPRRDCEEGPVTS